MDNPYFDIRLTRHKLSPGALFCISLINEYNNTTVKRFTVTDKEVDLKINITDVRIFHNMFTFYGDYFSLQFIRNLIIDKVKEYNDAYKDCGYTEKMNKEYDIRVTGSGYVTHSVIHY